MKNPPREVLVRDDRGKEEDDNKGSGHKKLISIIPANSVTLGNGLFNEKNLMKDPA